MLKAIARSNESGCERCHFGRKSWGELGKGLGEGIRGFREALKGEPAPPAANPPVAKDGAAKDKEA